MASFQPMIEHHVSHTFNIIHQYRGIRQIMDNLFEGRIVIHIDFSENYACKRHKEVQSAHFGYRHQVTIHQGMIYCKVNILEI
jgi:hypothetical protein